MVGGLATIRGALIGVCLGAVSACGVLPDPSDPLDIAARTKVFQDRYDGMWNAQGPKVLNFGNSDVRRYVLRAYSNERSFTQVARAQLYVIARLDDWLFLDRAYSGGVAYEVYKIDREVDRCTEDGCKVIETVGINMSIDQLRAIASGRGFDLRISGRKGAITLFVPATYFQGFLIAIGKAPR